MHQWGDKDVDWRGIEDAAYYIASYCAKWGRLGGQSKEKYGTVRFYAHFGGLSLHTLIYSSYVFNQFPDWLWRLDCGYLGPALNWMFGRAFWYWQRKVYSRAYTNALRRWPHLRAEILVCADCPELIKGVTRREDNMLHILGWNGEILSTWETYE